MPSVLPPAAWHLSNYPGARLMMTSIRHIKAVICSKKSFLTIINAIYFTLLAVSTSAAQTSLENGVNRVNSSTAELYVNSSSWADAHFSINGGGQQNVRMSLSGGRNVYAITGLSDQDRISYSFTYFDSEGGFAVETDSIEYVHNESIETPVIPSNLTQNATAVASTERQAASNALDGNPATRWESNFNTDPSWLSIDLGAVYALSSVSVHWEAANAKTYRLQGSLNNQSWVDLATGSNGTFGERTDEHSVSGSYRYVRMLGLERSQGNQWGYSIFEMAVYGTAATPPEVDNDADNDGVENEFDDCPNTPEGINVGTDGCAELEPIDEVELGDITPLYDNATALQADTQFDRGDALVTRFSDRPRTRHAREDQFQAYDHYVAFPLDDREAENRWWYYGQTTVAQYAGNGGMEYLGRDGIYYSYTKSDNLNRQFNRPIQIGDRLEFEVSQFSREDIPRGQANYYGTTFLYIVGKGIVPWYTENAGEFVENAAPFQEDSREIPSAYWLGGNTTLAYQYTNEPNDHFMQMATNLGYDHAQVFLEGRRLLHSSFIDGAHDELPENGVFETVIGLGGAQGYVNDRCTGCHERNGGAPVAANNEPLDRWVIKVGDAAGNPDPSIGRVLQPNRVSGAGEGNVSIASWTDLENGLRRPNYHFEKGEPERFSARIAPRLVGLGLLEAIPESTILSLEDPNDENGDGISGRASRVLDPSDSSVTRLGRFGWKASTATVRHQVAAALNTDMGVRTNLLPNLDCGASQAGCSNSSPVLDDGEVDKLVTYLSGLGVRPQRGWETGVENSEVVRGKDIFVDVGCSGCHTPTVQTSEYHPMAEVRDQTIHPYSDLLLHDMGPELADNLGEGEASGSEWRTTPLWGLGLAACVTGGVINPTGGQGNEVCSPHHAYLHDGRARTIDEAILWHGGEGASSRTKYQALSNADRQRLITFLESL